MFKITLILPCLAMAVRVSAQNLSVKETLIYLQDQISNYKLREFTNGAGFKFSLESVTLQVSEQGYFTVKQSIRSITPYYQSNDVKVYESVFNYHDVIPVIDEENSSIILKCKNGKCCQALPEGSSQPSASIGKFNIQGLPRLKNAFTYLLDILQTENDYNKIDDDPFSQYNFKKKIIVDSTASEIINLGYDGIISTIQVNICGRNVTMELDSGASDISISSDLEKILLENGLISKESYLKPGLYKLADGNIVSSKRLIIPFLKVGKFQIKDVICTVNPSSDILLLGKSFLNLFSNWSVDNKMHTLILKN